MPAFRQPPELRGRTAVPARARPTPRRGRLGAVLLLCLCAGWATGTNALVLPSPDTEPPTEVPEDFPYWEHVTQRRYDSPSVIYLGGGWALTARHVGMGEIFLEGEIYEPEGRSRRTLLNIDGTPADAMVFRLDDDAELPNLPLLPLAQHPPQVGEEVLLIGFGRGREKVVEWTLDGEPQFGFQWTKSGSKRWGTNRVASGLERIAGGTWTTISIAFLFDPPFSQNSTRYEAHAATGDSGGAVFVRRGLGWELAGMMTSVSSYSSTPSRTSSYGDITYAADISTYRSEILRYTRPACSNEQDDDGDERTDYPQDPGCDSPTDSDERDGGTAMIDALSSFGAFTVAAVLMIVLWRRIRD